MSNPLGKKEIKKILEERFAKDNFKKLSSLPSPSLFKDIKKATHRVVKAIKEKEPITIVGDYDVDGVISSSILFDFLRTFHDNVEVIIPNRFSDGYGVSESIIKRVKSTVVITVDNGISAVEAAKSAKERGVDLIITDHHEAPDILPDAYAIVNPKQKDCSFPYKEICGAQVAWYFAASIKGALEVDFDLLKYIDFLAVAIIADMIELKEFNRAMVKRGLKEINQSNRFAWIAIRDYFEKDEFVSEDISYLLAPLINSTGRLVSAKLSFDFLNSTSLADAKRYLLEIVSLNEQRKEIEKELFDICKNELREKEDIIIVWGEGWHEGVIGIVASRLSRKYKKPAIVFSIKDGVAKGSARSYANIDILSLIEKAKERLIGYGGHKGAAGLSINVENLEVFRDILESEAKELDRELFVSSKGLLGEIDPKEIDFELLKILEQFEPYGVKNPKPIFYIKNVKVKKRKLIGKEKNHQKIILESNNTILESIDFNYTNQVFDGNRADVVFNISKNSFRGYISPQLLIEEISVS